MNWILRKFIKGYKTYCLEVCYPDLDPEIDEYSFEKYFAELIGESEADVVIEVVEFPIKVALYNYRSKPRYHGANRSEEVVVGRLEIELIEPVDDEYTTGDKETGLLYGEDGLAVISRSDAWTGKSYLYVYMTEERYEKEKSIYQEIREKERERIKNVEKRIENKINELLAAPPLITADEILKLYDKLFIYDEYNYYQIRFTNEESNIAAVIVIEENINGCNYDIRYRADSPEMNMGYVFEQSCDWVEIGWSRNNELRITLEEHDFWGEEYLSTLNEYMKAYKRFPDDKIVVYDDCEND